MKYWISFLLCLGAAGGGGYYYYTTKNTAPVSPLAAVRFAEVTRGPISVVVNATGQLQPVTQVDVGSQVSGIIEKIHVDFNSPVTTGTILAQLNTDNFAARVASNAASLKRAEASSNRLEVELANSQKQAKRLTDLYETGVVSKVDFENAIMSRDSLTVQVKVAKAEIEQAQTALKQSQIDLEHATILSPIDGVVINRAVEVGQTVAASFNSPLLFQIANDLTRMQIKANIDEADIGRIKKSKKATFSVDAFPGRVFDAQLSQVRLNPTVTSNVVIYTCIFSVENRNADGAVGPLLPGLTANLSILIDSRDDTMLVPAPALRFQPKGIPGIGSAPPVGAAMAGTAMPGTVSAAGPSASRPAQPAAGAPQGRVAAPLTGPAIVWIRAGDTLKPITVEVGMNDGNNYEIISNLLKPGDQVAVGLAQADAASGASFNPFGAPSGGQRGGMPRGMR